MTAPPDWNALRSSVEGWVDDTLAHLEEAIPSSSAEHQRLLRTAQFNLKNGREYLAAAFDAFQAGRFFAGLACVRVAYEIGVTLLWAGLEGKSEDRLQVWYKDHLRQRVNIFKEMQKMYPEEKQFFQDRVDELQARMGGLGAQRKFPQVQKRIREIENDISRGVEARLLYPLYRVLSTSAHADLDLRRHFASTRPPRIIPTPEMPRYAPWVTMMSAFWLAYAARACVNWKHEELLDEYEQVIRPML